MARTVNPGRLRINTERKLRISTDVWYLIFHHLYISIRKGNLSIKIFKTNNH